MPFSFSNIQGTLFYIWILINKSTIMVPNLHVSEFCSRLSSLGNSLMEVDLNKIRALLGMKGVAVNDYVQMIGTN